MDYINRNAARAIIEEQQKSVCYAGRWGRGSAIDVEKYDALEAVLDTIDAIPAADVAPVRHGEWTKAEDNWDCLTTITCSECHEEWCFETEEDVSLLNYRYCPNCGARMDLGGAGNG